MGSRQLGRWTEWYCASGKGENEGCAASPSAESPCPPRAVRSQDPNRMCKLMKSDKYLRLQRATRPAVFFGNQPIAIVLCLHATLWTTV